MWRDLGAYRLAERASLYVEIIFGIQRHSSLPSGDGYSFGIRRGQFLSRKGISETKNHGRILHCNIMRIFRD